MDPVPPPRPALAPALARRLDRLAFRAHAFHRWAHHPLCREYEGEVFRFGHRLRLCRGCTLAAAGAAAGLLAGALLPVLPPAGLLGLGCLGAGAGALALARRRIPKVATRALPAALPPGLLLQALRGHGRLAWSLALLAWAAAAAVVAAYRRRGPDRTPCATCPEATGPGVCRGFRDIRRRERAFARLAGTWLGRGSGTMGP